MRDAWNVGTRFIASTLLIISTRRIRMYAWNVGTRFIASRPRFNVRRGGRDKSRPYIPS